MTEALTSKQLSSEGKEAYQAGDYAAAARAFEAASQSFAAAGDLLMAAEMQNNSSVAYLKSGDAETSLHVVESTPALFASSGDTRRQGMALGNLGSALEALGRTSEAVEAYRQSAELLQQVGEHELRAYVMQSLSAIQLRSGKSLEALATMQSSFEGIEKPTSKQRFLQRLLNAPMKFLKGR